MRDITKDLIDRILNREGYVSDAQRKAVHASKADEKKKMKKEDIEQVDEAGYKVPKNYAAMMAKKRKKAGATEFGSHPDKKKVKKEEVEQVDELSVKTLTNYNNKASKDPRRAKMNNKAVGKIVKKTMQGEEVEQVDELKKSTVKSYVSKAIKSRNVNKAHGMDHLDRSQSAASFGDTKMSDSEFEKGNKRFAKADKRQSGIDRAKKRYNEDVEQVDELDTSTLKSYIKKANKKALKARNSYSMAASRRSDFADDTPAMKKNANLAKKREDGSDLASKKLAKKNEALTPAQDKHLDVHDDGKIDSKDFKKLRDMRKKESDK